MGWKEIREVRASQGRTSSNKLMKMLCESEDMIKEAMEYLEEIREKMEDEYSEDSSYRKSREY